MALHVKALSDDTSSYFLTFIPSACPKDQKFPETFPGAFTILVDPCVSGPRSTTETLRSNLSLRTNVKVASLDVLPEPDIVLVSKSSQDHCHEDSLCQLNPDSHSLILAESKATRRIKRWGHFYADNVQALKRYRTDREDTLFRMEIPPPSPSSTSGELTIALLGVKPGLTGSATNAVGITYRAPTSVLSLCRWPRSTQPQVPTNPDSASALSTSEDTISVLYSPHGVSLPALAPWLSHLETSKALPPLALIHSLTKQEGAWCLAGTVSAGFPGGRKLATSLLPTVWIASPERRNISIGRFSRKPLRRHSFDREECQARVWRDLQERGEDRKTEVIKIRAGGTVRVDLKSVNPIVEAKTEGGVVSESATVRDDVGDVDESKPKAISEKARRRA